MQRPGVFTHHHIFIAFFANSMQIEPEFGRENAP
jgi:hypothetical protein